MNIPPAAMRRIDQLRLVPLLHRLDHAALEQLEPCARARRYTRGRLIWHERDEASHFTFILQGHVKAIKQRQDGQDVIIDIFSAISAIDDLATYHQLPRSASAVALNDVVLLTVHRDHLIGAILREPSCLEQLLRDLAEQHQRLLQRFEEVTTASAEQRLALLFLRLAAQQGRPNPPGQHAEILIALPLSRQDICHLINTRVETAIRLLSRWRQEGLIQTGKEGFVLSDLEAIRKIANSEP